METQDWTEISYEEARASLKKWREEHTRRSEETIEIWEHVLSPALDCARHDLAIDCLQVLTKKFPRSSRVTKLQAMRLEALGNYDDANYLYDKLIEADETNMVYRKRKIAILIAKANRQEAIRELNAYLETFINDSESWLQLSELFLYEGDFGKASFCFEELLLSNPQNATYLCRLAEIRYSQGGAENFELSKAYYEKAIKLVPNANAYYGLILACNNLLNKATAQKKKELISCGIKAADSLIRLYTECPSEQSESTENPTLKRQLTVIRLMRSQFKDQQ